MIEKMLQIKELNRLTPSNLKLINGGDEIDFCSDDRVGANADCHRFDEGG